VDVERVADGLWRWTTRHPEWVPDDGWDPDVACVFYEADDAVVLVDPLIPSKPVERERFLRALDRDVDRAGLPLSVLLTIFWHERSAAELVARYGGSLWVHEPAVPRVESRVTRPFRVGDRLPGGIEPLDAHRRDEVIFWVPAHAALVEGDALLGDGHGGIRLPPDDWLQDEMTPEEYRRILRPLVELPVERVLLAHGDAVRADARAPLARALEER
jgi:glyoxylase-like metal-dependent hydrolase (beta-lactamase superfamily II)